MFSTGSERIAVIEDLRKLKCTFPGIRMPTEHNKSRVRGTIPVIQIWLMVGSYHVASATWFSGATYRSHSSYLPPRMEYEYFKSALRKMGAWFLSGEHSYLTDIPQQRKTHLITKVFYPHCSTNLAIKLGTIFMTLMQKLQDIPIWTPLRKTVCRPYSACIELLIWNQRFLCPQMAWKMFSHNTFIDRHGDIICLSNNALVPFASLAVKNSVQRIKRFHVTNIYRPK